MLAGSCKVQRWLWASGDPEAPNLPATEVLWSLGTSFLSALRETVIANLYCNQRIRDGRAELNRNPVD